MVYEKTFKGLCGDLRNQSFAVSRHEPSVSLPTSSGEQRFTETHCWITEILQKLDRFHSLGDICAVYRKQMKENLIHLMDLFQFHWCSFMMFLIHSSPNSQKHSSVSPHFYFKQYFAIALFSEDVLNYTFYSRTNIFKLWSKDSNALLPLLQHKGHHCQPPLKN